MGITAPGTEFFRPETKPKFRVVSPARDQISKIVRRTGRPNAAYSRKVSAIRDSADCVVADAVTLEPVSSGSNSRQRAKIGNFTHLIPSGVSEHPFRSVNSINSWSFPVRFETGIPPIRDGNFNFVTRLFVSRLEAVDFSFQVQATRN
jgi:hypothetical protein